MDQRSNFQMTYLDEMYKISGIEQTSDQLAPAMLYSCFHDSKQLMIYKFLLMPMSHQQKRYQFLLSHSKPDHLVRFIVSAFGYNFYHFYINFMS